MGKAVFFTKRFASELRITGCKCNVHVQVVCIREIKINATWRLRGINLLQEMSTSASLNGIFN